MSPKSLPASAALADFSGMIWVRGSAVSGMSRGSIPTVTAPDSRSRFDRSMTRRISPGGGTAGAAGFSTKSWCFRRQALRKSRQRETGISASLSAVTVPRKGASRTNTQPVRRLTVRRTASTEASWKSKRSRRSGPGSCAPAGSARTSIAIHVRSGRIMAPPPRDDREQLSQLEAARGRVFPESGRAERSLARGVGGDGAGDPHLDGRGRRGDLGRSALFLRDRFLDLLGDILREGAEVQIQGHERAGVTDRSGILEDHLGERFPERPHRRAPEREPEGHPAEALQLPQPLAEARLEAALGGVKAPADFQHAGEVALRGVDRLHHLEIVLQDLGARAAGIEIDSRRALVADAFGGDVEILVEPARRGEAFGELRRRQREEQA